MKYLNSFKLFEHTNPYESIIDDIKDICLEFTDNSIDYEIRTNIHYYQDGISGCDCIMIGLKDNQLRFFTLEDIEDILGQEADDYMARRSGLYEDENLSDRSGDLYMEINDLINDTNIIQDVLPSGSGNANYDENNFIVVLDSSNVNRSDLTIGALTYFYNKPLTNYGVSIYWFGGIPSSIAQFIGNGDDTFWTAFSTTTQTIASGASVSFTCTKTGTAGYYPLRATATGASASGSVYCAS